MNRPALGSRSGVAPLTLRGRLRPLQDHPFRIDVGDREVVPRPDGDRLAPLDGLVGGGVLAGGAVDGLRLGRAAVVVFAEILARSERVMGAVNRTPQVEKVSLDGRCRLAPLRRPKLLRLCLTLPTCTAVTLSP
jgi:hypothetical protein